LIRFDAKVTVVCTGYPERQERGFRDALFCALLMEWHEQNGTIGSE
jgi:hypothetical protein